MKTIICPKCKGQGIVEKPPWIPASVNQWASGDTTYVCNLCNGAMVVEVRSE